MKTLLLMLTALLASAGAFAQGSAMGGTGGNGGFSVTVNGRSFTYDLYESGLHETSDFGSFEDPYKATELLKNLIPGLEHSTARYFAYKLNALRLHSAPLARRLLDLARQYEWKMTPGILIPGMDIGATPIIVKDFEFNRVIFRDDRRDSKVVWINRELFSDLDDRNQSALILHELFYAVAVERKGAFTSENVRKATSLVYSPNLEQRESREVMEKLRGFLGLLSLGLVQEAIDCQSVRNETTNLSIIVDEVLSSIKMDSLHCIRILGRTCSAFFEPLHYGFHDGNLKTVLDRSANPQNKGSYDGTRLITIYRPSRSHAPYIRIFIRKQRDSRTDLLRSKKVKPFENSLLLLLSHDPIGACIPEVEKQQLLQTSDLITPNVYSSQSANGVF